MRLQQEHIIIILKLNNKLYDFEKVPFIDWSFQNNYGLVKSFCISKIENIY